MTTFAVLATGPSMSQELADSLKHLRRIAVNDAYELAPDAEALVANDQNWWKAHPEALAFKGRKFSAQQPFKRDVIERVEANALILSGTNSGLLGVHVAIKVFGATRVELYGFDMRGTHYFGPHTASSDSGALANTKPQRFDEFRKQFAQYGKSLKNVSIVNCTPGSALTCFPFAT